MRSNYFKKLGTLSLGQALNALRHPSLTLLLMRAPRHRSLAEICRSLYPQTTLEKVEQLRLDFLRNHKFFAEVDERFVPHRGRRANFEGWPELLYVLVRIVKPEIFIETGIFDGISSAVILQAMADNQKGRLVSVDLPATGSIEFSTDRMQATVLPEGMLPGWIIPDYLRSRHELMLGDSKKLLPEALKKYTDIDIFMHDSLHTFEHQWFEYNEAWPHLKPGGLLLSDDIFWNLAFDNFSKKAKTKYFVFHGFGVVKK